MDFRSYLTQEEIHTPTVYYNEEDDDVLYDELKRQVLQLTAEDDDVHHAKKTEARKLGPFYDPFRYYDWPGIKEDCGGAPPSWMLNLWRSGGNGTGVFIPQTTVNCSRRRNRSRKNKNDRGRVYKQVEKMK